MDRLSRLINFDKFINENYEKCLMDPKDTYPIDIQKSNRWIELQCYEIPKLFANVIMKYMTHISFMKFYETLLRISGTIQLNFEENHFDRVVLIIDNMIQNSNTWISVLLFKMLRTSSKTLNNNIITDIIKSDEIIEFITPLRDFQILFLYPDDVLFTGNQFISSIKPKLDYLSKNNFKNLSFIICSPFIGNLAFNNLHRLPFVHFSVKTEFFNTLIDQIALNKRDINENLLFKPNIEKKLSNIESLRHLFSSPEYYKIFQYKSQLYPIYFDHKLPNGYFTFQKLLAIGSFYGCNNNIGSIGSLIKNCENNIYKVNGQIPSPTQEILDFDNSCPNKFYHEINYTFNERSLNKDKHILDELL